MKTRIVERITKGGEKAYYPQYRSCFIWFPLFQETGSYATYSYQFAYNKLEAAKKHIDDVLANNASREDSNIIQTNYIKYP